MKKNIRTSLVRNTEGLSTVEYVIILMLIAVVGIVAWRTFGNTVVGKIKFGNHGEWEKARLIYVQYQGVKGNDPEQFKKPGVQPILYPPEFKSGDLKEPYSR